MLIFRKQYKVVETTERPPFVRFINYDGTIVNVDGYTLQIDINNLSASIINLKKRGNMSMVKTVEQVRQGYEKIYEDVVEYEKNLEERVRQQMANDLERVKAMKQQCLEIVEVEVPDEEIVAETEEVDVTESADYQC